MKKKFLKKLQKFNLNSHLKHKQSSYCYTNLFLKELKKVSLLFENFYCTYFILNFQTKAEYSVSIFK